MNDPIAELIRKVLDLFVALKVNLRQPQLALDARHAVNARLEAP